MADKLKIIDMDKLLDERVWLEPDGSFIRLEDIPNRRVFQIEKKLRQAVSSGASNYVKNWCCVFMDEANLRREMMAGSKNGR